MNSLVRTVARSYRSGNLYNNRTISLTLRNYCSTDTKLINQDEIGNMVKNSKVVVFMKGVPEAPRCGFSNAVVQIMRMHGVPYDSHDVLQNDDLREGIKKFSNWPTIPQVFINGEFVGGCDIMLEMHQNGELIEELKKCGIKSALLDKSKDESKNKEDK